MKSRLSPTILPCTRNDYSELINIWEQSVKATHTFITEKERAFYRKQILDIYFDAVNLHKLILQGSNNCTGFIGTLGNKLEMLFIAPEYFKQGYGSMLLEYAINSLNIVYVDVNEENAKAHNFYIKHGFVKTGYSHLDGEGKNHPIVSLTYIKRNKS